jgi:hypothetical protein
MGSIPHNGWSLFALMLIIRPTKIVLVPLAFYKIRCHKPSNGPIETLGPPG